MVTNIISGKEISASVRADLTKKTSALKEKGVVPGLCVILVGEDPASISYVTGKERACEQIGIYSDSYKLPLDTSEEILLKLIDEKNKDKKINGILVQLPLPKHIDEQKVIEAISPEKDVDGFHPMSVGRMMLGQETFLPCTPHGVVKMLEFAKIPTSGKHVVIVGRSNIVGKPLANLLVQKSEFGNATVTVCHTGTTDMKYHTLQADILVAAVGRANVITKDMIREGAVVIDVGVNRVEDSSKKNGFRLVGDVDFDAVNGHVSHITPVPGGVGPMTITMLMYNTVESASRTVK